VRRRGRKTGPRAVGARRAIGARSALGFLTVLGGAAPLTPRALGWFGPVGLVVGGLVGVAWWAASQGLPAAVAAGQAVVVDLAVSGLIHVDGLADTADGLLPPLERSRRLEVMRQPDVGAFGVTAVVVVLGLRGAALAALAADARWTTILLIAGLWATSRAMMALILVTVAPARPDGLAAAFRHPGPPADPRLRAQPPGRAGPDWRRLPAGLLGLALGATALALGWGWPGLVVGAAGLAPGAALVALAHRRLGGCTGDVLGAVGLVVETGGLVMATVWA
jgi:adenosylcobinamide-GDP ribazoletransferase